MGIKLKYSQPIYLDEVAADFPELKIISAHPTWPWTAESLAIARHKANYFIDLSGWAPKYFPAELLHNINTLLQDKAMFGSDWPAIGVERDWTSTGTSRLLPARVEVVPPGTERWEGHAAALAAARLNLPDPGTAVESWRVDPRCSVVRLNPPSSHDRPDG